MKLLIQIAVSLFVLAAVIGSGVLEPIMAAAGWLVDHTLVAAPVLSTIVLALANCWIFTFAFRSLLKLHRFRRGR